MCYRYTKVKRRKRGIRSDWNGDVVYCTRCQGRRKPAVVSALMRRSGDPIVLPVFLCVRHGEEADLI